MLKANKDRREIIVDLCQSIIRKSIEKQRSDLRRGKRDRREFERVVGRVDESDPRKIKNRHTHETVVRK